MEIGDLQLQTVMDSVKDGFIMTDECGEIISFNLSASKIFGYTKQQVIGQNITSLLSSEYRPLYFKYVQSIQHVGDMQQPSSSLEVLAIHQAETVFPVELSVSALEVRDKTVYLATVRDITERKEADQSIKSYIEHIETIMDTVLDGLITIDMRGTIHSFNAAAEAIFGYRASDVVGRNVKMLMPEPYQSEHDMYLENYHQTGDKKIIGIGREITGRRHSGHLFPMELGVNEMVVQGKTMFVGTVRDISERKAAEAAIDSYIRKLQISNSELDQFAYIASHDLKEPLRGLANNALFLEEDHGNAMGDEGVRRIQRIRFLCTRMEKLVDSLLYYSRLGRQDLAVEHVDLNALIDSVAELTLPEETAQSVSLSIPKTLPCITCDKPKVSELFRNLISNAVKYNKSASKEIEIGVKSCIEPVHNTLETRVFYVKDNGQGIDSRFFEDIFRIFKRLNEEDDSVRGTGVGLTFVKKIVERHNGQIWVESELGRGSCFNFTLKLGD
ncbi:PAS domain-containing sensor histidine kinase [Pseudoalteromonas luteoviolacea]|uniref:PAS domain-containing sensor histidine kinase n=1 Tax=Pseudoalteromonas luteoviolacea TaxID=43657 RepID=UPI0011519AEA|nr:PAS domain S-box protein [Pseudoalteromonas luteoviolacea]TQF71252.1 PAS domain S-box protein [Pseudoalteromonas luteoviolacea]